MIKRMMSFFGFVLLVCDSVFACEEKAVQCIPINNGMLTEIPGIMVAQELYSINDDIPYRTIYNYRDTYVNNNREISVTKTLLGGLIKGYEDKKEYYTTIKKRPFLWWSIEEEITLCKKIVFTPLVIEMIGNSFVNRRLLGKGMEFSCYFEMKKAIKQNKAVYCPVDRGILIYDFEKQPDIDIYRIEKNKIDRILLKYDANDLYEYGLSDL